MSLDRADRRRLRSALSAAAPWLADPVVGPTTVDAGSCDRCGERPRIVETCGPATARTLCVDCVLVVGTDGWCDRHRDVAEHARSWAERAPSWWADAVVLSWIATGEVIAGPDLGPTVDVSLLPAPIRAAIPQR